MRPRSGSTDFLRRPPEGGWSLRERPGFLRLHGSTAGLDTLGSPAFVGRRQRHFRVGMRAWLDFSPRSDADRARLALRANEGNHYELTLTGGPGQRLARASTRIQGRTSVLAEARVPDGPVELGIEAFPDRYELSVIAGGAVQPLGSAPTAPLSSEAAGGFTGVYIGLFATTRAHTPMPPADFDAFEYAPDPPLRAPRAVH